MTTNKKIVQLSLVVIGLFLILITYFYPKFEKKTFQKEITENKLEADVKNEFDNVTYKGENAGNLFILNAVKAEIREDVNIIFMKKMLITISLSDREWVVECEVGEYNKSNYNILCSKISVLVMSFSTTPSFTKLGYKKYVARIKKRPKDIRLN